MHHWQQPNRHLAHCLALQFASGIECNVAAVINTMNPLLLVCRSLRKRASLCSILLFVLIADPSVAGTVQEKELGLAGDVSVSVRIHAAAGNRLLLWFPSEYSFVDETQGLANSLAASGIEVWRADLLAAHFLPPLPSSIYKVPDADIAAVINHAIKDKRKTVTIFADGRGAVLALRGVMHWQHSKQYHKAESLIGAVLLSPNLYVETPQPGQEAQYLPITGRSTLNTFILQPQMSPLYWWRDRLKAKLTQRGSGCDVRVLEGVRDRFYFRPDATPGENKMATVLPVLIRESIVRLERMQTERQ